MSSDFFAAVPSMASDRSIDKDATIRSNRSNRSNRSMQHLMTDTRSYRVQTPHVQQAHQHQPQHQTLPPPPYQASPMHDLGLRRDSSPSTIVCSESDRWDDRGRNARWSVWTADTTLNYSDDGDFNRSHDECADKNALQKQYEGDFARDRIRSRTHEIALDRRLVGEVDDAQEAGPSSSYPSRSSTPPSPTTEAALDAALSSTMLALTTANSLLLSTMASRRELARLRAMEATLDHEFVRKEAEMRRQLESNNRTIEWMERACKRLDDVIEGRESSDIESMNSEELDELTSFKRASLGPTNAPGSRFMARHHRAPSTAVVDAREVPIPFGIVEAKDTNATVGKSAAKRLERMLQRPSLSGMDSPSSAAPIASPELDLGTSSSATPSSSSGFKGESGAADRTLGGTPSRHSRIRHTSSNNALHLRLAASRPAAVLTSPSASMAGPSNETTPVSEQSLRLLGSSSRQSLRSESESSVAPSSSKGIDAKAEEGSSAARLLSSFIAARPTSGLSAQGNLADGDFSNFHQAVQRDGGGSKLYDGLPEQETQSTVAQFLTPPMPIRDLPDMPTELAAASPATPGGTLRHRPSLSSTRSPSALRMEGHMRGTGSSVTNEARGVAVADQRGSRKGALEALRKLNGGSGEQSTAASTPSASDPPRGWGGTLASWMGISGGGGGGGVPGSGIDPTTSAHGNASTTSRTALSPTTLNETLPPLRDGTA